MAFRSYVMSVESGDREEGEIVDEYLEDISDDSIIEPLQSGKSVSRKEHLHALSLSSEEVLSEGKSKHRGQRTRRRKWSSKRPSKRTRTSSHKKVVDLGPISVSPISFSDSDSDSVTFLEKQHLKSQLEEAIRIEDEAQEKNSLKARLTAMTGKSSLECGEIQEVIVLSDDDEEQRNSDVNLHEMDKELIQLRLEALRTAVFNKFETRKKKKIEEVEVFFDASHKSETNKENTTTNNVTVEVAEEVTKKLNEVQVLSDASHKSEINKENTTTNNVTAEVAEEVTKKLNDENLQKVVESDVKNNNQEDDEDVLRALLLASMSKKITKDPPLPVEQPKPTTTSKSNTITKTFPITKVKPLIIKVNADSDSDDDLFNEPSKQFPVPQPLSALEMHNAVDKFLKEQRAKVESKTPPSTPPNSKPPTTKILAKSAVRLLPRSKQIEYQKLLLKLKKAEGKPRLRKTSELIKMHSKTKLQNGKSVTPLITTKADLKTEPFSINKAIKEIQTMKDGRLQIHDDYKLLRPILHKITTANTDRKKHNQRIKQLQDELVETKKLHSKSTEDFLTAVSELKIKKLEIEKIKSIVKKNIPPKPAPQTQQKIARAALPSEERKRMAGVSNLQVTIGDPNDVDQFMSSQSKEYLKYVSPLDNCKRINGDDPLAIICPFEMSGKCRDTECSYKHIGKN